MMHIGNSSSLLGICILGGTNRKGSRLLDLKTEAFSVATNQGHHEQYQGKLSAEHFLDRLRRSCLFPFKKII